MSSSIKVAPIDIQQSKTKDKRTAGPVTLSVRIQPRASKNEIITMENGGIKIRLTAPPVDNAANEALVKFLSQLLSVARSSIEIVSGHTSRDKIVRVSGMNEADARRLLYEGVK
jgi:uncharacterized protein (TIGR00251 family)